MIFIALFLSYSSYTGYTHLMPWKDGFVWFCKVIRAQILVQWSTARLFQVYHSQWTTQFGDVKGVVELPEQASFCHGQINSDSKLFTEFFQMVYWYVGSGNLTAEWENPVSVCMLS